MPSHARLSVCMNRCAPVVRVSGAMGCRGPKVAMLPLEFGETINK